MSGSTRKVFALMLVPVLAMLLALPHPARANDTKSFFGGLVAGALISEIFDNGKCYYPPARVYRPRPAYYYQRPIRRARRRVYYAPQPVYYAPQPVYYAPQPVYYAPRPVYYAPRPVYYNPRPVYYNPRPVYYNPRPVYRPYNANYGRRAPSHARPVARPRNDRRRDTPRQAEGGGRRAPAKYVRFTANQD